MRFTTLLAAVIEEKLGSPLFRQSDGAVYWQCPNCGAEKFHTWSVKPDQKDRWSCWVCGIRGDVHDFLQAYGTPEEQRSYDVRKRSIDHVRGKMELFTDDLWEDGRQHVRAGEVTNVTKARISSFGGLPFGGDTATDSNWEPTQSAAKVWDELTNDQRNLLRAVFKLSREKGVSLVELAHQIPIEEKHLMECTDPECINICCRNRVRAKQGLPPLTDDEVWNGIKEERRKKAEEDRETETALRQAMPWAFE